MTSRLRSPSLLWTFAGAFLRFEPRFREAGLSLQWRAGEVASAWVRADGRRLEQVIDNLLANALRYVPAGGTVEVTIERRGGRAVLSVEDDGPGFSAPDLPHLFERFYRADAARGEGGTGLGLAIVREIVQAHGGSARAANRVGEKSPTSATVGASIKIELPLLSFSARGSCAQSSPPRVDARGAPAVTIRGLHPRESRNAIARTHLCHISCVG